LSFYWWKQDWDKRIAGLKRKEQPVNTWERGQYPYYSGFILEDMPKEKAIAHHEAFAEGRATLDDLEPLIAPCDRNVSKEYQCILFEQKRINLDGMEGIFRSFSPSPLTDVKSKEKINAPGPISFQIFLLIDREQALQIQFSARGKWSNSLDGVDVYQKWKPTVDEMLKTVRFVPPEEVGEDIVLKMPYESPVLRISERRDFHADSGYKAEIPSNWDTRITNQLEASAEYEQGTLVVEHLAPEEDSSDYRSRIMVVLQGLPVTSLTAKDFLETTKKYLSEDGPGITNLNELSSAKQDHPGLAFLAKLKSKRSKSTKKTYRKEFEGSISGVGNVDIQAYTAGGLTIAANILVIGEPNSINDLQPTIDEIVKSIKVNVYSPVIKF
jgi:hypothetical protein